MPTHRMEVPADNQGVQIGRRHAVGEGVAPEGAADRPEPSSAPGPVDCVDFGPRDRMPGGAAEAEEPAPRWGAGLYQSVRDCYARVSRRIAALLQPARGAVGPRWPAVEQQERLDTFCYALMGHGAAEPAVSRLRALMGKFDVDPAGVSRSLPLIEDFAWALASDLRLGFKVQSRRDPQVQYVITDEGEVIATSRKRGRGTSTTVKPAHVPSEGRYALRVSRLAGAGQTRLSGREAVVTNAELLSRMYPDTRGVLLVSNAKVGILTHDLAVCDGREVMARLRSCSAMAPVRTQLVESLLHRTAHCINALGVNHYDIKPGNVVLDMDGTLRPCDFDLAQSRNRQYNNDLRASPWYRPMEVVEAVQTDGDYVGNRVDPFSLGVTALELLLGQNPFLRSVYVHGWFGSIRVCDLMCAAEHGFEGYEALEPDCAAPEVFRRRMNERLRGWMGVTLGLALARVRLSEPELAEVLAGLTCMDAQARITLDGLQMRLATGSLLRYSGGASEARNLAADIAAPLERTFRELEGRGVGTLTDEWCAGFDIHWAGSH